MTTTTAPVPSTEVSTGASRPSARRRAAVAAAALVACALPVTFTVTITAMLVDRRRRRPPLPPAHRAGPGAHGPVARCGPAAHPGRLARAAPVDRCRLPSPGLRRRRRRHLGGRRRWRRPSARRRRRGDRRPPVGGPSPAAAAARHRLGRPGAHAARPARRGGAHAVRRRPARRCRTPRPPATTRRTRTCSTWPGWSRPSPCWRVLGAVVREARAASSPGWPAPARSSGLGGPGLGRVTVWSGAVLALGAGVLRAHRASGTPGTGTEPSRLMPTLRRMPAPVVAPRPLRRRGVGSILGARGAPAAGAISTVVPAVLAVVASVVAALVVLTGDVWSLAPAPRCSSTRRSASASR